MTKRRVTVDAKASYLVKVLSSRQEGFGGSCGVDMMPDWGVNGVEYWVKSWLIIKSNKG